MKKILLFVMVISVLFACGCTESDDSPVVEVGDNVSVNYTGSLEDGTVFDSSSNHGKPLTFNAGMGRMIKGFDDAVMGMAVGEKKTVTIPAEDAYGEARDEMFITYTMDNFSSTNITPVIGQKVSSQGYEGTIVNITEENVTIDYNYHLAGKTLIFDIEMVSIEKAQEEAQA